MEIGSSPVLSEFLSLRIYLLALEKMLANDNESFAVAGGAALQPFFETPICAVICFRFRFCLGSTLNVPCFFGLAADGLVNG